MDNKLKQAIEQPNPSSVILKFLKKSGFLIAITN